MNFGLIIIGDEILSGKRADKHLAQGIRILGERGLQVAYAHYVGDDPDRITATLSAAFASGDVVFSFGGIGATPDDHTRQCAARALGREMALHPEARDLIYERMQDIARENGQAYDPDREDNQHRLQMGVFPLGARIIPNPYNKIAGFTCQGGTGGAVHFVPGFPVMAWPMVEWVLDTHYRHCFHPGARLEKSVIVMGAMEATLTPLMVDIESRHSVKVFSLPSVDHPEYGEATVVDAAFASLREGLAGFGCTLGPELVRTSV
jgi:molybdopterin-biosynthesis enzyme MoeA-like protein